MRAERVVGTARIVVVERNSASAAVDMELENMADVLENSVVERSFGRDPLYRKTWI